MKDRFQKPDRNFPSLENNIHIWKFPVIHSAFPLLTVTENEFARRYRFEKDRIRFSAGRQGLRLLLSRYLSADPSGIIISAEPGQKPFLAMPSTDIQFNISHSGNWVLIAFARREIGIDVEQINQAFEYKDLLEEHFSDTEREFISDSSDPRSSFYFLWTRKEACTKAWGTGLQENLKQIPVLEENYLRERNGINWRLQSFNITEDHPAALAFADHLKEILYFNGSDL